MDIILNYRKDFVGMDILRINSNCFKISDLSLIPRIISEAEKLKEDSVEIIIKEGNYFIENTIKINTGNLSVTIKAEGNVRLIGGKKLYNITYVKDQETYFRFDETVRNKVLQCNLNENGIENTGEFISRGFSRSVVPSHSEIFIDTKPLNISQFPKKGKFLNIMGFNSGEVNEWGENNGKLEDGFFYDEKRPSQWINNENLWVHGYWSYDWANSYENVDKIDTEKMFIKTKSPYGNYQFRKGQRFYFLNILEEVNCPGDYFIDKTTNILYFIPYEESFNEVIISLMKDPIFIIENNNNVILEGLTIEAVCGHCVMIKDSSDIKIHNCHLRNAGNYGLFIRNSKNIEISCCTIHDNGDGGIDAIGGNRLTLEPANILIYNNHIYNIAKWSRCYQTAANISGVGMTVKNNLIHDCPHTAVLYWGNDMIIENNEIYNVVMETGDAGGIYTGRNYTFRGNEVCGNYIHHLGGVGMGTMGIYNDDCVSGTVMKNNFFFEVNRAAFLGGGRDFIVKNNVFVNCYPSIEIDGRGANNNKVWRNMVVNLMKERFYHITDLINENTYDQKVTEVSGNKSPYIEKYPELNDIHTCYQNEEEPFIVPSAVIENNVMCSDRKIEFTWDSEKGEYIIKNNYNCSLSDFRDG
ncbi:MAG: putative pectin lyase, partial [Clostridia bacterium]|nr:putative pectin lyase [Clostridia bacterium]